jgi:hypothetical protein
VTPQQHLEQRGGPTAEEADKRYEHGTYARFTLCRCKCDECKRAGADYNRTRYLSLRPPWRVRKGRGHFIENRLTHEIFRCVDRDDAREQRDRRNARCKPKPPNELIPARAARKHMLKLRALGIGAKTVHAETGLAYSVLQRIASGDIKRTRRCNAEKILAVDVSAARGTIKIDGRATWKLLDAIIGSNLYSRGWIALQLGSKTPILQMRNRSCVRADKARLVKLLYDQLWETDKRFRVHVDPTGERKRERAALAAQRAAAPRTRSAAQLRLARALGSWDADEFSVRFDRLRFDRRMDESLAS